MRKLKLRNLLRFLLIPVLFSGIQTAFAQTTISLKQHLDVNQPAAMSIDRMSNIYLSDSKNNVYLYSETGKLLNTYSPPRTGRIANIEAWNAMKVLVFYDDQQRITLLDRFMNNIATLNLRDFTNGLIKVATTSADERLWLFNESEFSLIKFDPQVSEVTSTTPLNLILPKKDSKIRFIREYQNMVYLVDQTTGIYVFDNLGNYKKTLPFPGLSYVGFKGDELYYLSPDQKLHFFNLYSFKETIYNIPIGPIYRRALASENFIYLLSDKGLDMFAYE